MRGKQGLLRGGDGGATSVEFAVLLTLLALSLMAGAATYGLQLGSVFASTATEVELIGNVSTPGGQQPAAPPGGQGPGGPPGGQVPGPPGGGGPGLGPPNTPPGCGIGNPLHCP
jgi:Flp pilus assembly pilin Flp